MKKTVYAILIFSLIIGIPLMVMDVFAKKQGDFKIPSRFEKVVINLGDKARTKELLFTNELKAPSTVEFMIQSDTANEKNVMVVSESDILGYNARELNVRVGNLTGTSSIASTFTMDKGKYSVYLTSEKADGEIAIGYQETAKEPSEFERLSKIHKGNLNNPPEGYQETFSADLTGRVSNNENIYTLSLDKATNIGLSVYISPTAGNVSVDFVGESANYFGIVNSAHNRICDQLETILPAGEYQFRLTSEDADGQLYIFLKQ